MNASFWLNSAWGAGCYAEALRFRRATRSVAAEQARLLQAIVRKNRDCEFGRDHRFERISSVRDFQRRVPLTDYESYKGAIHRLREGASKVLTAERVELLEPTSGSHGGAKLIPYTAALRRQFQRAVACWICDLFWRRPAVRLGRAYWSISPAMPGLDQGASALPIGFADDTEYLGGFQRMLARRLLAVPSDVAGTKSMAEFRYATLLHLLRARDLALVSVWSPTYLTTLLDTLEGIAERICRDLRDGTLMCADGVAGTRARLAIPGRRGDVRRSQELERILASPAPAEKKFARIWPDLALISCWADGASMLPARALQHLFPQVEIQPKGILATEGVVSIPLVGKEGAALAVRSHFFEFHEVVAVGQAVDSAAPPRLAHELQLGGRYEVVMTTGGGLYRYQLRDVVQVVGFVNQCPLLRFLGRAGRVSDLVGEKLGEPHVRQVLENVFACHGVSPRFALVAPVEGSPPHYRLFVQGLASTSSASQLHSLQAAVERGLCENPYYRQAVQLGQLGALRVHSLDDLPAAAWSIYEQYWLARGQKAGDIKPVALDNSAGWADRFRRPR